MLVLYFVITGILLGYVTGGRLKHLVRRQFRFILLAVSAFLVQIVIFSDIPFLKLGDSTTTIIHLISYLCLLAFILLNIKIPGIAFIGMGILSNALVIFLNGGYMPTYSENLKNTSVAAKAQALVQNGTVTNSKEITSTTILPWLGDIFYLPAWIPFSNVFSIGDIIIAVGICVYFIKNMKPELTKQS
jgi:hypothetical protein